MSWSWNQIEVPHATWAEHPALYLTPPSSTSPQPLYLAPLYLAPPSASCPTLCTLPQAATTLATGLWWSPGVQPSLWKGKELRYPVLQHPTSCPLLPCCLTLPQPRQGVTYKLTHIRWSFSISRMKKGFRTRANKEHPQHSPLGKPQYIATREPSPFYVAQHQTLASAKTQTFPQNPV